MGPVWGAGHRANQYGRVSAMTGCHLGPSGPSVGRDSCLVHPAHGLRYRDIGGLALLVPALRPLSPAGSAGSASSHACRCHLPCAHSAACLLTPRKWTRPPMWRSSCHPTRRPAGAATRRYWPLGILGRWGPHPTEDQGHGCALPGKQCSCSDVRKSAPALLSSVPFQGSSAGLGSTQLADAGWVLRLPHLWGCEWRGSRRC